MLRSIIIKGVDGHFVAMPDEERGVDPGCSYVILNIPDELLEGLAEEELAVPIDELLEHFYRLVAAAIVSAAKNKERENPAKYPWRIIMDGVDDMIRRRKMVDRPMDDVVQ